MVFRIMKSLLGKKNETVKSFEDVKSFEFNHKMSMNDLQHFAKLKGTKDLARVESEYFQDLILYILSSYPDIVFKGGTALRKFWDSKRFSADLDFVGNIPEDVLDDLLVKLDQWGYPARISEIREYGDGNITVKLAIKGIVYLYHHITIDLFPTSPVTLPPQVKQLVSIFPDIPPFTIPVMSPVETLAEKIRTLFSRDNPQDLHDVSFLLDVASLDWQLVNDKFEYDGLSFSFNELDDKISNLKTDWKKKLTTLLPEVPEFDGAKNKVLEALCTYHSQNHISDDGGMKESFLHVQDITA